MGQFGQTMVLFESKMGKIMFKGLENKTRPLLSTVLGLEYEFYLRIINIAKTRSNLGQFGQEWANLG